MAESRYHSRQSSICSESSRASINSAQQILGSSVVAKQPPTDHPESLLPGIVTATQVDPLSREYPKPVEEINVAEMLQRKPMKWSLGHYIQVAPTRVATSELAGPVRDKEQVAQDLEAKKRELLEAKEQMRRLSLAK